MNTTPSRSCQVCQKNKRLSLVRKNLVEDLAYIDQKYYPDVVHYDTHEDITENEAVHMDDDDQQVEEWSKLTIGDITPKGRRPRRLTGSRMSVNLSGKSLVKLSPSIGFLDNLTKLNLSHNHMTSLPLEIGYLKNLRVLNAAHNQLQALPDTIAYLSRLKAINVGYNELALIPSFIGRLSKIVAIIVNNNLLTEIPKELGNLNDLISLNVSHNPLKSIPAEIAALKSLRKLHAEGCSFVTEFVHNLASNPPSLLETCARIAVRNGLPVPVSLPQHLKEYIGKSKECSYCHGPYFDCYFTRGRFVNRNGRQQVALEYKLCCSHWNNEDDRIINMFAEPSVNTIMSPKFSNEKCTIDMEGFNRSSSTPLHLASRSRAFSEGARSKSPSNSYSFPYSSPSSPHSVPSLFAQKSISSSTTVYRSGSQSEFAQSLPNIVPIQSLKHQPSLPALPALSRNSSNPGSPQRPSPFSRPGQRPRSLSSNSITRRFTNYLTPNSQTGSPNPQNSTSLRQQTNRDDLDLDLNGLDGLNIRSGRQFVENYSDDLNDDDDNHENNDDDEDDNDNDTGNGNGVRIRRGGRGRSRYDEELNFTQSNTEAARSNQHQHSKVPSKQTFRAGLAQIGARLVRGRSETM
ncbi:hypothetical protein J3Q64DRAFT_1710419 [Phycomyces blakesleeanus]|uniref:Uncharacterized protein n=1 Tax=Phycomyces blakesleeanus TaxID=4837 RepID=A0ABR3BDP1_PHYBL